MPNARRAAVPSSHRVARALTCRRPPATASVDGLGDQDTLLERGQRRADASIRVDRSRGVGRVASVEQRALEELHAKDTKDDEDKGEEGGDHAHKELRPRARLEEGEEAR